MSAPSKRKRGRPDVFERDYHEYSDSSRILFAPKVYAEYRTKRSAANNYYMSHGFGIIKESASDIPYSDLFINVNEKEIYCKSILEQLGRMLIQDGYSKEDIVTVAKIAAELRHDGYKVKQIAQYIRKSRKTNEW